MQCLTLLKSTDARLARASWQPNRQHLAVQHISRFDSVSGSYLLEKLAFDMTITE